VKSKRIRSRTSYTSTLPATLILRELLSDFEENNRDANDLRQSYQGPAFNQLKRVCTESGISNVDFELAIDDLHRNSLIKTGPPEIADSASFGGVLILPGIYSKREYAYLKEDGYREAKKLALSSQSGDELPKSSAKRTGVTIHGDQYIVYGQAGAIGPQSVGTINLEQQWTAIQNEVDLNALTGELEQLRQHLQQNASSSSDYQQLALLSEAEEHAKKRDGSKAMEVLSKVGKGALGVAKDIGTEIAAKVIAKSMGLEP
jgi:ribosomal protein S15P/S13E